MIVRFLTSVAYNASRDPVRPPLVTEDSSFDCMRRSQEPSHRYGRSFCRDTANAAMPTSAELQAALIDGATDHISEAIPE